MANRSIFIGIALVALLAMVAVPAFAVDPSPSAVDASPSASAVDASPSPSPSAVEPAPSPSAAASAPARAEESEEPAKGNADKQKADKQKGDEVPVTLNGTVSAVTDSEGKVTYTLRTGGVPATTYTLEAGPAWFFGDNHPLKPYIGKSVTVVGEKSASSNEVDVQSVDGKQLRAPGKPPWAGGWKRVGKIHPGWSQEKADRFKAKFGDCWPPGHCKDKPNKAAASPAP